MPQQIAFDFSRPAPTLRNFIAGRNRELLARLASLDFPAVLYVWGASGSGKTHLVDAARAVHGPRVVAADDVHTLDAGAQELLFDAFNAALAHPESAPKLVVAGDRAPLQLALREDLRTRFGAGLVFELQPLSDDEKRVALIGAARERGLPIGDEFVDYLLTRWTRDMRSLVGLLDALDRYSLATRRPVTLPLLRELMQRESTALAR